MTALLQIYSKDPEFRSLSSSSSSSSSSSTSIATSVFNGLTVDEIERRSRRIDDNKSDALWRVRSFEGFLGADETLASVLARDWHSVIVDMKSSHAELAQHLIALLSLVEETRRNAKRGAMATIDVQFDTRQQPLCSDTLRCSKPVALTVSRKVYAGEQFSLFANNAAVEQRAKPLDFEDEQRWNDEYLIESKQFGFSLLVGGHATRDGVAVGVPSYIQRYGFYEGGLLNAYRVAPTLLGTLLSGRVMPHAVDELNARHAALLARIDAEIRSIDSEIAELATASVNSSSTTVAAAAAAAAATNKSNNNMQSLEDAKRQWLLGEKASRERERDKHIQDHKSILAKVQ